MKNILLVVPSGGVGGIERLAVNFYNHYKKIGHNVKVLKIIKLENDIVNFGADELFLSEKDFSEMSFVNKAFFYLKSPYNLRQIIKKYKIDTSLGFGDIPNIFSSLTFTNDYKIVSLHALKSVELSNNSFLSITSRICYRTSYYFIDKIVCISEAIKIDLITNCNFKFTDKLAVIYNPHDLDYINVSKEIEIESAIEKKIFEKPTIVFLGRLTGQKSPWHLVKAFSLLKNYDQYNLVFIGDGVPEVLAHLQVLINKLNLNKNIHFIGRKNNPYQYLKKAKLLVLSSYYEGTPNVIVEAIACEIPIVSSNCTDGILELMSFSKRDKIENLIYTESGIITPNFYNGSLIIPQNNDYIPEEYEFAKALEQVLSNNCFKENVIKNKVVLLEKFNLEFSANSYLDLYFKSQKFDIAKNTDKLKILFCTNKLNDHGGIEKILSQKINYFIKTFHHDAVLITHEQNNKKLIYDIDNRLIIKDLNINYFSNISYYHPRNLIKVIRHFYKLRREIKLLQPDFIISVSFTPDQYFIPFISKNIIKIKELHSSGIVVASINKNDSWLFANLKNKLFNILYKYDSLVLLNKDELQYFDDKNAVIIPNFTDFELKSKIKKENTIIAVGRISEVKQFEELIHIWKIIAQDCPDWKVKIFGDGDENFVNNLLNMVIEYNLSDSFFILNAVENIQVEMQKASIYAMTSRTECFPMVLLEAMVCGLPIISYDCPTGPKNIIDDNINGFLIENKNREMFANKLKILINNADLRNDFAVNANQSGPKFNKQKIMQQWDLLFRDLVN